jgi:hypothetical protein
VGLSLVPNFGTLTRTAECRRFPKVWLLIRSTYNMQRVVLI